MVFAQQVNLSTPDFNKIIDTGDLTFRGGGSQGVGSTEGGSGGSVGALVNVGFSAPAYPAAGDGNIFFEFLEGTTTTRVKLTISGGSSRLQQEICPCI